jgi:hypothetical protein
MKKLIPSLVAAFLLSVIIPAHATLMVYGVINGVVDFYQYSKAGLFTIGLSASTG